MAIKTDIRQIQSDLNTIIDDDTLLFDARLILDELICNGINHGNKKNKDKLVDLLVEISEEYLKIEVEDQGSGFNYNKEDYDPFKLSTGGRGLKIVDGLSDEFYVKDNKVVSIKYMTNGLQRRRR